MPPQLHGLPPNPRNPFANLRSKSDYEGDSDTGSGYASGYASANASTIRLAGTSPLYDQSGESHIICCLGRVPRSSMDW